MPKKDRIDSNIGSNDPGDETPENNKISPGTNTKTQKAGLAQKKKKVEEALAKAKESVNKAVIPARLPGDIQKQTL